MTSSSKRLSQYSLALLLLILLISSFVQALNWSNDLATYQTAWEKMRVRDLSIYDTSRSNQGGYYYSPFFALLGVPLSLFDISSQRLLYALITTALAFLGWRQIQSHIETSGLKLRQDSWPWVFVVLAMINNVVGQYQSGNVSLWLVCFAIFAFSAYQKNKISLSAFWIALAVNIKIYPIFLLLYFIWHRDLKWMLRFALWSTLLLLAPSLWVGLQANIQLHLDQIQMVRNFGSQSDHGREALQGIPSLLVRLKRGGFLGEAISESALATSGQLLVLACGVLLMRFFNPILKRERIELFFLLVALMALFNPASWVNNMGVAYAPMVAYLVQYFWGSNSNKSILNHSLLWIFFAAYCLSTSALLGRELNDRLEFWSVPALGVIALVIAFCRVTIKKPHEANTRGVCFDHND
jgi:hypothetical protein